MQCDCVRRELNACNNDQLPWVVSSDVERHLAVCASCHAHAARLRRLYDLLDDVPAAVVPEGFATRLLGAARRQLTATKARDKPTASSVARVRVLDAVAAIILLLGFTLGSWMAQRTWRPVETAVGSSAVASRSTHDIGSFYGAASDGFDIQRPLPQIYLTFVDRTGLGE